MESGLYFIYNKRKILYMQISIIFQFIKTFYKEIIIASLSAVIWFQHINNNILESELSLAEQQNIQVTERLTNSNATISQLQGIIGTQNQKLEELNTLQQTKIQDSKLKLQEAFKTNNELQKEIDSLEQQKETGNMCQDIENLLNNIGK